MIAQLITSALVLAQPQLEAPPDGTAWHEAQPFAYSRVEIETPGGPLPFVVGNHEVEDWTEKGLTIHNGKETIVAGIVRSHFGDGRAEYERTGKFRRPVVDIELTGFGVRMRGESSHSDIPFCCFHQVLTNGTFTFSRSTGTVELPFRTSHIQSVNDRFDRIPDAGDPAFFAGRWAVDFSSTDDPAVGVIEVDTKQIATGTFLTPTGDYRYLAGRVDGGLMRLSAFDGAHAFLFHARMQADGTIKGDFWSGNWHHDTWTAVRDERAALPDAFEQTAATGVGVEDLAFRDLDGTPTRVADLLNAGDAPARVLYLFGSWCPNCADAGAEMKRLKDKYGEKLTVVGLAFEQTEDFPRSARQVRLYSERHGADWPVLIAGLADKAKASAELPVLDRVRAFPTTIFLNARNEIVAVHTGFNGPATGDEHRRQQREFEGLIDGLIAEP
jgi:thiol-disulfide isomerase/thioredoxin